VHLVDISKLEDRVRHQLLEYVNDLASELGVNVNEILIYEYEVVPIRIQHLVNELGRRGQVLLETLILDGRFFLLALKKSSRDLKLATDYESRG